MELTELREQIGKVIFKGQNTITWFQAMDKTNQILAFIKEVGYMSPDEINKWLEEQGAVRFRDKKGKISDLCLGVLETLRLEFKK